MGIFGTERPASRLGWLALLYVLGMANVYFPLLRLSSPILNYLFFAGLQIVPWYAIRLVLHWVAWRRWALLIPTVLMAGVCGTLAVIATACSVLTFHDGGDRSFERRASIPTARGTVVVYRTSSERWVPWGSY
jgi:hypothetical protein